jgi:hypothetical protein
MPFLGLIEEARLWSYLPKLSSVSCACLPGLGPFRQRANIEASVNGENYALSIRSAQ